ncbi:MAG: carbamoyl phosphate synthetase [Mucilaginibacter sp.]|nr:carbamoyl phosphate synthetase [Mucilaginibacter sp.]
MIKSIKSHIKEVKAAFTNPIPYPPKQQALFKTLMFATLLLTINFCFGQTGNGNSGIQSATNEVKGYFADGCSLMYAIGAVVGIIGAIKVFNKWNAGEPDTNRVAAAWFGSCIFLVVVATVLKSFFGV